VNKWLTLDQVVQQFDVDDSTIQGLLSRGAVRTGVAGVIHAKDVEECLGAAVAYRMNPDAWLTYSDLWRLYGIRRSWLDLLIKRKLVGRRYFGVYKFEKVDTADSAANLAHLLYRVADVMAALAKEPEPVGME